jgi:hypothetical protein
VTAVDLQQWLRAQCQEYVYDLRGVFRIAGSTHWPLTATHAGDLEAQLHGHGHLLPLPKEPAALANVLEVSIVDFLLDRIAASDGALTATRGGERFYPDLEVSGPGVDGVFYAVDIKIAQRKVTKKAPATQTQSRDLYAQPGQCLSRRWPGTHRPGAVANRKPQTLVYHS